MSTVLLVLAVVVAALVVAVAAGRLGAGMPEAEGSSPHRPLPAGPLAPADLDALRFSSAVRGYRMDEVDAVLARLRAELADRTAAQPVEEPVAPAGGDVAPPPSAAPARTGSTAVAGRSAVAPEAVAAAWRAEQAR